MSKYKKTIAVLDPCNKYLSHCTWNRALKMLQSGNAVRLNATTIRLKQTRKERVEIKHRVIDDSNRVCYICGRKIPYDETATVDHVIPRSRDGRAEIVSNMKPIGEKFPYIVVEQYLKEKGLELDEEQTIEYYLVMNMFFNDYRKIFEKYPTLNQKDIYFDFSRAFIDDIDAPKHKVGKYFKM